MCVGVFSHLAIVHSSFCARAPICCCTGCNYTLHTGSAIGFCCNILPIHIDGIGNALFRDFKIKRERIGVSAAHSGLAGVCHVDRKGDLCFVNRSKACCCIGDFMIRSIISPYHALGRVPPAHCIFQRIIHLWRICTRCCTVIRQFPAIIRCNVNFQRAPLLHLCRNFQLTRIRPAFHLHGGGDGDLIAFGRKLIDSVRARFGGNILLVGKHFLLRQSVRRFGKFRRLGKRSSTHCKAQGQRKRKAQQFFCTMFHGVCSSLCGVAAFLGANPLRHRCAMPHPPFVTCGDIFPRPGEICPLRGGGFMQLSVSPHKLPLSGELARRKP